MFPLRTQPLAFICPWLYICIPSPPLPLDENGPRGQRGRPTPPTIVPTSKHGSMDHRFAYASHGPGSVLVFVIVLCSCPCPSQFLCMYSPLCKIMPVYPPSSSSYSTTHDPGPIPIPIHGCDHDHDRHPQHRQHRLHYYTLSRS